MPTFWPEDITVEDLASPEEIIEEAAIEWHTRSNGKLTLVMQEGQSGEDEDQRFLYVHAQVVATKKTVTLFSILHREGLFYPCRLIPKNSPIPNFLLRDYETGGIPRSPVKVIDPIVKVHQKWVCETPSEFRKELAEVMRLPTIKAEIISLLSSGMRKKLDNNQNGNHTSNDGTSEVE